MVDLTYFVSPEILDFLQEKIRAHGPGLAGSLFGAGWCVWFDAVLINRMHDSKLSFVEYLPGIVATLAMILMCFVRRSDLGGYDAFDSAAFCRQRFWLFIAYVVSFVSIIGAVGSLLKHSRQDPMPASYDVWSGWAAVLQVTCVLGSGLVLFLSRGGCEDEGGFYTGF